MNRTEEFLALFNELERFLRRDTDSDRAVPFSGLVGRASNDSAAVRHNAQSLREWADLRNAIVHEHPRGQIIAEVTPEALEEFRRLVTRVTRPPAVVPLFQRVVRVFAVDDPLTDAIGDLWKEGYSQIIVRQNDRMTMLSYAGITRWMGSKVQGTTIDLEGATVGDALPAEKAGGIAFLARSATVYDARDLFQTFPQRHQQRLRVIAITESGKNSQRPLGLITASDLLEADI